MEKIFVSPNLWRWVTGLTGEAEQTREAKPGRGGLIVLGGANLFVQIALLHLAQEQVGERLGSA